MKVLVTGAGGFLGRALVTHAVAAGHDVTALVRSAPDQHAFDPGVTVVQGDLRSRGEWCDELGRIDVVLHAAAAASGSRSQQLANTVVATERLLEALGESRPTRFVHVSSLSVYDFHALRSGAPLDERTPLEPRPHERDAYTEAKLVQERLVREWCEARGVPCVILRPGAIVGPEKAWGFGAAFGFGRLAFVVAPRSQFRFISLSNCAAAVVRAIDADVTGTDVVNVIDDKPPTHAEFFRLCVRAGAPARILVPVPWLVLEAVGKLLRAVSLRMLGGRLRTPELLDHRRQEARWKPLTYPNERAHRVLGWRSTQSVDEAVRLAVGPADRSSHSISRP
jgi:nucleoside-diphosphate-sugar epimerase